MKTFIFIIAVLFSVSATATSLKTQLSARLLRHDFDQNSPLASMQIVQSDIVIDFNKDKIALNFIFPWSCPVNAYCALVMPSREFEVEYLEVETDECNISTFSAQIDQRPVDGAYQKITVRDFSRNTCPYIMVYPYIETSIEFEQKFYDRVNAKEVHYKHHFTAEKLN